MLVEIFRIALFLVVVGLPVSTFAQLVEPELVYDVNQKKAGDQLLHRPGDITEFEGKIVFIAETIENGREVWALEVPFGTPHRLSNLNNGQFDTGATDLFRDGDRLYFHDTDAAGSTTLWLSDGTPEGTRPADAAEPASSDVSPSEDRGKHFGSDKLVEEILLFETSTHRYYSIINNLHIRSIADPEASFILDDIRPVLSEEDQSRLSAVAPDGTHAYFAAYDETRNLGSAPLLWRTDGTTAGTIMLERLPTGNQSSNPNNIVEYEGKLYFTADDGEHGQEFWVLEERSKPPHLLGNLVQIGGLSTQQVLVRDGALLFNNANRLWQYEGATHEFFEYPDVFLFPRLIEVPNRLIAYTHSREIAVNPPIVEISGLKVFGVDPTLRNLEELDSVTEPAPQGGRRIGDELVFSISTNIYHLNLKTDELVLKPGYPRVNTGFSRLGDDYYAIGGSIENHNELWRMAPDITGYESLGTPTTNTGELFSRLFVIDEEMWIFSQHEGTDFVTRINEQLAVINRVPLACTVDVTKEFVVHGSSILFQGTTNDAGMEPWVFNGTEARMLADIFQGEGSSEAGQFQNIEGLIYFKAFSVEHGAELYVTDGDRVELVTDVQAGNQSGDPGELTYFDGYLYFAATNGIPWQGRELYRIPKIDKDTLLPVYDNSVKSWNQYE